MHVSAGALLALATVCSLAGNAESTGRERQTRLQSNRKRRQEEAEAIRVNESAEDSIPLQDWSEFQSRHSWSKNSKTQIPEKEISIPGKGRVTIKPTFVKNTKSCGFGVFSTRDVKCGEFVAVYTGEFCAAPMRRHDYTNSSCSHFLTLRGGGEGWIIDGSMHGRWDKEYYKRNGVGSFLNAGSGSAANCRLVCFPSNMSTYQYALVEEGQMLAQGERELWVLLEAKRDICAGEQLLWDYRVDCLTIVTGSSGGDISESSQSSVSQGSQ